jgi:hypothetical protein
MKESDFKNKHLKPTLSVRFPGCILLDIDPTNMKSFPDLLVLYGPYWAALETKRRTDSPQQPNQEYYVRVLDQIGFSRFVNPSNAEEVLEELEEFFYVQGRN